MTKNRPLVGDLNYELAFLLHILGGNADSAKQKPSSVIQSQQTRTAVPKNVHRRGRGFRTT